MIPNQALHRLSDFQQLQSLILPLRSIHRSITADPPTSRGSDDPLQQRWATMVARNGIQLITVHKMISLNILCEQRNGIVRTKIAVQCKCKKTESANRPKRRQHTAGQHFILSLPAGHPHHNQPTQRRQKERSERSWKRSHSFYRIQ